MLDNHIITENQLDEWVRGNEEQAHGLIVELLYRLVATSCPRPKERRFPLGDSVAQPGPDGYLETDIEFDPFVPEGTSFWEVGTGIRAQVKATSDYKELTVATPAEVRRTSTFIFVTPLSGRRDWPHTWKGESQAKWRADRRERQEWKDVRIVDGSRLIDWLHHFPAIERWLANKMGLPGDQMQTPELRWANLMSIGEPPPLIPQLFLVNRDAACEKLKQVFSGTTVQLKLDTHYPDHVADFVGSYLAAMDEDTKAEAIGRCLIITGPDAWEAVTNLAEPHILVADFDLDNAETKATRLLEKARRTGHAVIFGGMPGGIPHPNRVGIPNPRTHQIQEALENAGYNKERARVLAQKSAGSLSSLVRCIQNLSIMPEWAQGTHAAELAVAELLGSWRDDYEGDKAIAEQLSGNAFGEWIGKMREIALRPGTPLVHRDRGWKVVARYEGWYALGSRLYDEHLDRLRTAAVNVLCERDPKFSLQPDERYMASIQGKVLTGSRALRQGLADTLALLGSHPKALTSCSYGKAEATARVVVREILSSADWVLWASLNDLLPLLAEAAPQEFLNAVEDAVHSNASPFPQIFAQEGSGVTGSNYMTGLLWALETLAWDAEHLTRVIIILGELAVMDPGGRWANRPANSLSTILLPWYPQTCAAVGQRKAAVSTLLTELPDVAWGLLLKLLPQMHQISSGSRKPSWRNIIGDDWSGEVTRQEYREQVSAYAELAITAAKLDVAKLAELIHRLNNLPQPAFEQVVVHLTSTSVMMMPDEDKLRVWTELVNVVLEHRKFSEAEWAMQPELVEKIAAVAERLSPELPVYRHQRLFTERDFDLLEDQGNWEEQHKKLDEHRQDAVQEIFAAGGVATILQFASSVESPWRVGAAFGVVASASVDTELLPELLELELGSLARFVAGFVWGRFRCREWEWVDQIDTSRWTLAQRGQFLAFLPFVPATWQRVTRLLGSDEASYWLKALVNPYEAQEGLDSAVDHLLQHGRCYEALRCLETLHYNKHSLDGQQAVRALRAVLASTNSPSSNDGNAIRQIIKALQNDPSTNPHDLLQMEWAFLPLLDRHYGASPKLLEQQLADDPAAFCFIIRTVFRSKKDEDTIGEPTESLQKAAKNGYELLHDWRTPPGMRRDGTFNGEAVAAWVEDSKALCSQSGHLEIAMTMLGHVLTHTPADPDGLWIHHAVATVLNAKDAKDMRDGFRTAIFNSRGFHTWTAGEEERELAAMYRRRADEVDAHGYHRLASCLRDLAASYDNDAERAASRDLFDY